jgi:hypothetical protein
MQCSRKLSYPITSSGRARSVSGTSSSFIAGSLIIDSRARAGLVRAVEAELREVDLIDNRALLL